MNVTCMFCGCEFESHTGWRRVMGFERKGGPSRRGGSDIALRQPYQPEAFACHPCVDGQKHGRSPHQEGFNLG